ncbi:MAG: F420-dependent methylenetetrahydromethanopterin dehydrogenase [Candidatus Thorarchaeota archaeon]
MSGDKVVKVGILKLGCIGAAPLLDYIFDERADREDIEVRGFSSGAKMDEDSGSAALKYLLDYKPQLAIVISPNAALPGPSKMREELQKAGIPTITISDAPSKKAFYEKNEKGKSVPAPPEGQGFIILNADSMIGARREFLDPTEMILFNSDMLKVLAATGYVRFIQTTIDDIIADIAAGKAPDLPAVTVDSETAVDAATFSNPYAHAKAIAAAEMAEHVANLTTAGCFKVQEASKYIPLVAAAHEMLRTAALLADEARELEKGEDTLYRTPHAADGTVLKKEKLGEKPKK